MRSKKYKLCVILCFFLFLVGCSRVEEVPLTEVKEPIVTIDWLGYNTYVKPESDSQVIKAMEEKLGVNFNVWYIPKENYLQQLTVRLSSGDLPDVFKANIKDIPVYHQLDILGEVPRREIEENSPTIYKRLATATKGTNLWNSTSFQGKNYGMPLYNSKGNYGEVVVWRDDWLENVGVNKIPTTLEEFEEALYRFRHGDPDGNGKKDTYGMSDYAMGMVFGAFGVGNMSKPKYAGTSFSISEDGLPVFSLTLPGAKEAIALMASWYEMGIIDPQFVTSEDTHGYWAISEAFHNSRIGLTSRSFFYHWNEGESFSRDLSNAVVFKEKNPKGSYVFGEPPIGPKGYAGTSTSGNITNAMLFTTKATSNPDKVQKILQMWDKSFIGPDMDEELYELMRFGIENETFAYNEAGLPISLLEGLDSIKKGLIFDIHDPKHSKLNEKEKYEFAEKVSPKSVYEKVILPPTLSYSQYKSELRKTAEEAVVAFITGEKPMEDYELFVESFMESGGQLVQDDIQKAWIENNK